MLVFRRALESLLLPIYCLGCGSGPLQGRGELGLLLCLSCSRRLAPWELATTCYSCGRRLPPSATARVRCGACLRHPLPWVELFAGWWYLPPADSLMRAFKYQGWDFLGGALSSRLVEVVERYHPAFDAVVPVAASLPRRLRRRYNPPRVLARHLSTACRVPLRNRLIRWDVSSPQAGRSLAERCKLQARFTLLGSRKWLDGRTVLLVDDVLTTGATAAAAAEALHRAGAKQVMMAVACRTPLDRDFAPAGWKALK